MKNSHKIIAGLVVFAAAGTVLISLVVAGGKPVATEGEDSILTGPARLLSDSSAHGESGVEFSADQPSSEFAVSVQGNKLVDGDGQTVRLRGSNRSGTEYACVQEWGIFDGPVDDESIATMKNWGINAVRVPMNEQCWLGINGIDAEFSGSNYRQAISGLVDRLVSQEMYPILDLHWSAPGSQLADEQTPVPNSDHSPDFWKSVAKKFKDNPAVIFDLFNEPHPEDGGDSTAAWECLLEGGSCPGADYDVAGMQTLVDSVRSTGATNIVMVSGLEWSNNLSRWLEFQPNDPLNQTTASHHAYNFNRCNNVNCWNSEVAPVAAVVPVTTSELGSTQASSNFTSKYWDWAEENGVNYTIWTWNDWGCGIREDFDSNVLIADFDGTPCSGYGTGYKQHLQEVLGG